MANNEIVRKRRALELEILDQTKKPITIFELTKRLKKKKRYEKVTRQTVDYDVKNDKLLSSHRKLISARRKAHEAVQKRRDQELKILNQAERPITVSELAERMRKRGYPNMTLQLVWQDVNPDNRLLYHRNLLLKQSKIRERISTLNLVKGC